MDFSCDTPNELDKALAEKDYAELMAIYSENKSIGMMGAMQIWMRGVKEKNDFAQNPESIFLIRRAITLGKMRELTNIKGMYWDVPLDELIKRMEASRENAIGILDKSFVKYGY